MKRFSQIWFAGSIAVLPCILNLENSWCCLFLMANMVGSFLLFKKHNSEYILTDNKRS